MISGSVGSFIQTITGGGVGGPGAGGRWITFRGSGFFLQMGQHFGVPGGGPGGGPAIAPIAPLAILPSIGPALFIRPPKKPSAAASELATVFVSASISVVARVLASA